MTSELFSKKGAIFDLDGTLLDSMGVWRQIDVAFFSRRNIALPNDFMGAITPMQPYQAAVYTVNRFGLNESPDSVLQEWTDMAFDEYRNRLELKPYVREYIGLLASRGVRMSVASSSDRRMVEAALRRNQIRDQMEFIITSAEIGCAKGTPDIYLACAKAMNLEPGECAVYEDIIEGIRGAGKGGFYTVGVYEESYRRDRERSSRMPVESDLFIRSFGDLMEGEAHIFESKMMR